MSTENAGTLAGKSESVTPLLLLQTFKSMKFAFCPLRTWLSDQSPKFEILPLQGNCRFKSLRDFCQAWHPSETHHLNKCNLVKVELAEARKPLERQDGEPVGGR